MVHQSLLLVSNLAFCSALQHCRTLFPIGKIHTRRSFSPGILKFRSELLFPSYKKKGTFSGRSGRLYKFPTMQGCDDDGFSVTEPGRRWEYLTVLGLCGGIASGKSTASSILSAPFPPLTSVADLSKQMNNGDQEEACDPPGKFHSLRAYHIDADRVAHGVYDPSDKHNILEDLEKAFGPDVLTTSDEIGDAPKSVNRPILGKIVFSDPDAMSKLEELIWPQVKAKIIEILDEINKVCENSLSSSSSTRSPVAIIEAAVLLDAGWGDLLDAVWVVKLPRERALHRMMENRGMTQEDAAARIDAQNSRRGIENVIEELENGSISCIIENNGDVEDLRSKLNVAWNDPESWGAVNAPKGGGRSDS